MENYILHNGNSEQVLKGYADQSFDSVVCDPPYLIGFLCKDWDKGNIDLTGVFKECFRVLKPGGYLLAFTATRTYHRIATMIEDSGFEIRDMLTWIYSTGFPKGTNLGEGRYGVMKPAQEPIVMARKPFDGALYKNLETYGTGALNIDACRVPYNNDTPKSGIFTHPCGRTWGDNKGRSKDGVIWNAHPLGRYPANVIGEVKGYESYFYSPKPSRKEKDLGCKNNHPTCKPIALMEYLVMLVTPSKGLVLDPFMGSGTTGVACIKNGYRFVGCDLNKDYVEIARARIDYHLPILIDWELVA